MRKLTRFEPLARLGLMRWLVLVIVLRAAVAGACDEVYEHCNKGPFHPWSWTPLLGAQLSYAAEIHTQALVMGELRVRHGSFHDPNVVTASLRVTSANFGTVEPALILGYDFVSSPFGYPEGYRLVHDTRIAIGGGRSYGNDDRDFALAQLSVGMLWEREDGWYRGSCGERGECAMEMKRHQAQVDLVLEARIAADGEVRLALGFDFDPIRLWRALASF